MSTTGLGKRKYISQVKNPAKSPTLSCDHCCQRCSLTLILKIRVKRPTPMPPEYQIELSIMGDESFGLFEDSLSNITGTNTTVNPTCDYFSLRLWMLYSLIPAVAIWTLFCFLEKRVNLWPTCCQGRPGVAFPVNLVDSYSDRWSFGFAFGSMSTSMAIAIISSENILLGNGFELDQVDPMLQGTVKFLLAVINALIISLVFYPILLCLRTKQSVLGNILGFLYALAWLAYCICSIVFGCERNDTYGAIFSIIQEVGIHGSGTICFFALMIRFIMGIVNGVKMHFSKNRDMPEADFTKSHFYLRVKFLLTPPQPSNPSRNIAVPLFQRFIGTVPGFRFSRHNICTLVLTVVTAIQIALLYMSKYNDIKKHLGFKDTDLLAVTFWITNGVSIVLTLIFCIDVQLRYRKHTVKLWKGKRAFSSEDRFDFDTMLVSSLRYSGYQVAFAGWGFLSMQVLMWFISFLLITNFNEIVVNFLRNYWLTGIVMAGFYFGQIYVSRFVFLQGVPDKKKSKFLCRREIHLRLDNRRVFHVTLYITLFVNFLVGILSCFFRIVTSIILETVFIGRLDRCILMRGWEYWDIGFSAYIGFLELEVAHTHPVLVTFCHFLLRNARGSTFRDTWSNSEMAPIINEEHLPLRYPRNPLSDDNLNLLNVAEGQYEEPEGSGDDGLTPEEATQRVSRRIRNKWLVALTLARNPKLAFERKGGLRQAEQPNTVPSNSHQVSETDGNIPGETCA